MAPPGRPAAVFGVHRILLRTPACFGGDGGAEQFSQRHRGLDGQPPRVGVIARGMRRGDVLDPHSARTTGAPGSSGSHGREACGPTGPLRADRRLCESGGISFAVALCSLTNGALRGHRTLAVPRNRPVASIRVLSTFVAVVADRCRIREDLRALTYVLVGDRRNRHLLALAISATSCRVIGGRTVRLLLDYPPGCLPRDRGCAASPRAPSGGTGRLGSR